MRTGGGEAQHARRLDGKSEQGSLRASHAWISRARRIAEAARQRREHAGSRRLRLVSTQLDRPAIGCRDQGDRERSRLIDRARQGHRSFPSADGSRCDRKAAALTYSGRRVSPGSQSQERTAHCRRRAGTRRPRARCRSGPLQLAGLSSGRESQSGQTDPLSAQMARYAGAPLLGGRRRVSAAPEHRVSAVIAQRVPDNICIVMMSAVGDAVHVLPVINALKRTNPATRITWVLQPGPAALVRGHRSLDEIVIFDRARGLTAFADVARELSKRRFDLVINLQGYFKAGGGLGPWRAPG